MNLYFQRGHPNGQQTNDRCFISTLIRKCKLKPQRDVHENDLTGKSQDQALVRMWNNCNSSTACGVRVDSNTLGNWQYLRKLHTGTLWLSYSTPRYIPSRDVCEIHQKHMYKNVHGSTKCYNSQTESQISINSSTNVSFLNLYAGDIGMFILRKSTELFTLIHFSSFVHNLCIFLHVCYTSIGSFLKRWMSATVLSIPWVFTLIYFFLILMEKKFINNQQTAL